MRSSGVSGRGKPSQKSSSRNCRAVSGNDGSSKSRNAWSKFDLPARFSPTMTACFPRRTSSALKLRKFVIWSRSIRMSEEAEYSCREPPGGRRETSALDRRNYQPAHDFLGNFIATPWRILSLAARRKGIARCAPLHLDCARSALGSVFIGCVRGAIARSETRWTAQRVIEMSRSAFAIPAFTRCNSSCGTGRPSASSIK